MSCVDGKKDGEKTQQFFLPMFRNFIKVPFRHSTRKVHNLRPAVQAQSSDFTLTITKIVYAPRE